VVFTQKMSLAKGKTESNGRSQRYPNSILPAAGKAQSPRSPGMKPGADRRFYAPQQTGNAGPADEGRGARMPG
jgi:hypothetical protein